MRHRSRAGLAIARLCAVRPRAAPDRVAHRVVCRVHRVRSGRRGDRHGAPNGPARAGPGSDRGLASDDRTPHSSPAAPAGVGRRSASSPSCPWGLCSVLPSDATGFMGSCGRGAQRGRRPAPGVMPRRCRTRRAAARGRADRHRCGEAGPAARHDGLIARPRGAADGGPDGSVTRDDAHDPARRAARDGGSDLRAVPRQHRERRPRQERRGPARARSARLQRPRPVRGRPRHGQDGARARGLAVDRRRGRDARPVHARSAADRRHGALGVQPDQPGVRVPPRTDLRERRARRRDQPGDAEDAVGAAGGDGGATGDGRRRHAPDTTAVPAARDGEPDRVRGHVPAPGSAARPLLPEDVARVSVDRRGAAGDRRPARRAPARPAPVR